MCFLTSLPKILLCFCLIRSSVFAQSTGSDIYETAWEIGNAITNYDVIYVDWSGYTPPRQSGGVIIAELETRCRIVMDKANESCVLVKLQVITDEKSNRKGEVPQVLHYKDKKLTRVWQGLESPAIKNYARFEDFLYDNQIPLIERPLHYYFPTSLVAKSLDEHLENFRNVYSPAKVELLPDGKQLLKMGKEELKFGNGQYRAELFYDPTKFAFTQIKGIELGDKFPNGARVHCLVKPKYESVGGLFRLAEVEYEGFDGTANPVDKVGMVRFEWKGFNEKEIKIPAVDDLLKDSSSIRRFLEGKELE